VAPPDVGWWCRKSVAQTMGARRREAHLPIETGHGRIRQPYGRAAEMRPGGFADRRGVARRFGAKGHKCEGLVCRAVSGSLAIIGTSLRHVAMRLR
jgi:hypothetical protein